MTPQAFLSTLAREGLRLGLDSAGRVRCFGDRGKIDAFLPEIRRYKPALLALLAGQAEPETENLEAVSAKTLPWDAIRDRIQAGWRAEFGLPAANGNQEITWHPPGTWTRDPGPERHPDHQNGSPAGTGAPAAKVRCGDCRHAEPISEQSSLMRCLAGEPAPVAGGWWRAVPHSCERFKGGEGTV